MKDGQSPQRVLMARGGLAGRQPVCELLAEMLRVGRGNRLPQFIAGHPADPIAWDRSAAVRLISPSGSFCRSAVTGRRRRRRPRGRAWRQARGACSGVFEANRRCRWSCRQPSRHSAPRPNIESGTAPQRMGECGADDVLHDVGPAELGEQIPPLPEASRRCRAVRGGRSSAGCDQCMAGMPPQR